MVAFSLLLSLFIRNFFRLVFLSYTNIRCVVAYRPYEKLCFATIFCFYINLHTFIVLCMHSYTHTYLIRIRFEHRTEKFQKIRFSSIYAILSFSFQYNSKKKNTIECNQMRWIIKLNCCLFFNNTYWTKYPNKMNWWKQVRLCWKKFHPIFLVESFFVFLFSIHSTIEYNRKT